VSDYNIKVVWSEEDQGYVATLPEFEHLSVVEETPQEALEQFGLVLDIVIEIYTEQGWELPEMKSL